MASASLAGTSEAPRSSSADASERAAVAAVRARAPAGKIDASGMTETRSAAEARVEVLSQEHRHSGAWRRDRHCRAGALRAGGLAPAELASRALAPCATATASTSDSNARLMRFRCRLCNVAIRELLNSRTWRRRGPDYLLASELALT